MRVLVVHWGSDIQHNRSAKKYHEKSCEVHQQGFRAVPAEAGRLKEGELLQETQLCRKQCQNVDDKPRANVPREHPAPDCWRSTRVEEGTNAK